MNIVKILLITFAAILLIVISMVSIFVATFDSNEYKQELSLLVKAKTGRDLLFKGEMGLTLYPSLGMKLGSMTFSNAAGFGNEPMLAVNQASVSVDVLSILSFKPHIAELVLDGLMVNLQTNKKGVTNWDDLIEVQQQPSSEAVTVDITDNDNDDGVSVDAAFDGLAITDMNLKWFDAVAAVEYKVHIISLLTGKMVPATMFPVQMNLTIHSLNEMTSSIALETGVLFDQEKLTLSGLKLDSKVQGELIPVDQLLLELTAEIDFFFTTQQLSLTAFNSTIETTGGILESSKTRLSGEIGFDTRQQQLTVAVLDIQSNVKGSAVPNNELDLAVSSSMLDVKLENRSVKLQNLVLALNENNFSGDVIVRDYAQPNIKFALKSPRLDIDKLLGETDQSSAEKPETETVAEDTQIQLPMDLLRTLQLDGKLELGVLMAQGLTINNVLLKMDANQGIVKLDPIKMDLYDGAYTSSIKINAQGDKPEYTVIKQLSSFQIGQFLLDFMGDDKVSGDANLGINLTTSGEWLSKLKANLNGDIDVLIKDGALTGFNLRHKIESARARLRREKEPELIERKTDFSALSLSGKIKNGVLTTDDLDMQAPLVRVGGKGSVDLSRESVDYLVNAKLVTTSKGQEGGAADDLSGLLIPVAITGSWLSPAFDVQLDEILKARLKAEKARISESVARQKSRLKKKLDAEKAKLKLSQQKEANTKKQQLQKKKDLAEAEKKARLEAEKQKQQAELEAKKKAEKEKAKKKLEGKLKKLF